MILSITDKCSMGCVHCMGNYMPDGAHITDETLGNFIRFAKRSGTTIVLISGGEPTEHPDLIPIIQHLQKEMPDVQPTLVSNGTFAEDKAYLDSILKLDIPVQVTNDDRYYPRKVPFIEHPNIFNENRLACLVPQGRAANEQAAGIVGPKCFNIRSIARSDTADNFSDVIRLMELHQKYCQPLIGTGGTIHLGESRLCPAAGSICDDDESLFQKIRSFSCMECKLAQDLDPRLKAHIGG